MRLPFVRYDQEKMLEVISCRYMTRDQRLSYKDGGNNVRGGGKSRSQPYKSFVPTMGIEEEEETTAKEQRAWWQIEVCKKHQVHTQGARARDTYKSRRLFLYDQSTSKSAHTAGSLSS